MGRKMKWMKTGAAMLTVIALLAAALPAAVAAEEADTEKGYAIRMVLADISKQEPAKEPGSRYEDPQFAAVADQAIERLKGLGVMAGYPDGSFGEEQTLTRAEISKIAVIAAGLEETALNEPRDTSYFADVEPGHWANGWISVAARQGYIKGDGDGNFRPNDTLTQAEAVTVLLRTLGYNDALPGAWPANYVSKAAHLGVLNDITFLADQPIIRAEVAVMTSAILDQSKAE